jgi:energy-coupling factor transporter ATP-binding protein EcfA2
MSETVQPGIEEVFTETMAFAELLTWSASRPPWQRDALRRLVQNGVLNSEDIDQLSKLCLDSTLPHDPLSNTHVATPGAAGPIAILRIENPTGINALAADQKLEFAPEGLTIVYGDNGTGKSGYVRILKHACRTRDQGTRILRDVEDTTATVQSATIAFTRDQIEDDFAWRPDLPSHADLSSVSIFDSRSANIHVEKTNAVAYIPQPMQVLEALAAACDQVEAELDKRVVAIRAQTPLAIKLHHLSSDTAAGAFVTNLSASSNVAQLELLARLSPVEMQRLTALELDLAQEPKRAAAAVTNQKNRLDEGMADLRKLVGAASAAAFSERDRLKADWDTKAESAKLASEALFAALPLPDVGQATWRSLWESARKYSDEIAYPTRVFPDRLGKDEVCVLCQQLLTQAAIDRRITLEDFVKSSTKADEEAAETSYRATIIKAVSNRMSIMAIHKLERYIALEISDPDLAAKVRQCGVRAAWRLRSLLREQVAPCETASMPDHELKALSDALASRVIQLSADQNSPEHVALVKECKELRERKALAPLLADLKAEIERKKQVEIIVQATKNTAKKPVTTKNKELSDKLVTNALRGRFAREIEKLKLSRMPVELRKVKDANAVSYFQVALVEKPTEPVGEIFSEGEHRCVALAAFLAELVTSKQHSSIVFDDPMSSLDHIHRKAVAARLIEEAEHRQVIVFTHDLTFLFELRREAEARSRALRYQTVCRKQSRPGFVEGELPMKAKNALQLANTLRSELKEAKYQFDDWPDGRRTIFAKGIIEQLRETWDQAIADVIFPVLARFDNSIKGNSLFKLAVLSDEDVKTVTPARGRLSEDLHTSAETLNPEMVRHSDLVAEVGKLETWLADIMQRQKDAAPPVTSYT